MKFFASISKLLAFLGCILLILLLRQAQAVNLELESIPVYGVQPAEFSRCLVLRDDGVMIENQDALQALLKLSLDCQTGAIAQQIASFDFTRSILIGREFRNGTCTGNPFRENLSHPLMLEVQRDHSRRVDYHQLFFYQDFGCQAQKYYQIWYAVPKLPPDYRLEFQKVNSNSVIICNTADYFE